MNYDDRVQIAHETNDIVVALLMGKGKDYGSDTDANANFKRNATALGLTPFQVWSVYAGKHWDSILNAIKSNPQLPETKTEPLEGRIDDLITYLVILKSLLRETT